MKKINCHIGPIPPPLGGISIYLKRLNQNFSEKIQDDFQLNLFEFIFFIIKNSKRNNFIYHTPNNRRRIVLGILSKLGLIYFELYVHGNSLKSKFNLIERVFLTNCLIEAKTIYIVGEHIKPHVEPHIVDTHKIFQKPAFIPPNEAEENLIRNLLPQSLFSFINENPKNILINGSSFVLSRGTDLYGFDISINLISELLTKYNIKAGLIIAVADNSNTQFYNSLKGQSKRLGIDSQIFWITDQKEIWPLFKDVNVFIRPTNEDGYGISIDEALHFNCPAIASNVCKRNPEAIIFKNRNIEDLLTKVLPYVA